MLENTEYIVYDIKKDQTLRIDEETLRKKYPGRHIAILECSSINIISIYEKGERTAIINRVRKEEQSAL